MKSARELEKLLGGYMTGSLTESEHGELMRAALDDQQLFDALADEEALRDALADPVFRARLRARLAPVEAPPRRSLRWLWMLAPVMAAGLALVFVLNRPEPSRTMEMASTSAPQSPEVAAVPQPVPPPAEKKEGVPPPVAKRTSAPVPQASAPPPPPPPPALAAPPPPPITAAPKAGPPAVAGAAAESVASTAAPPAEFAEKKTTSKDESAAAPAAAAPELRKAAAESDALAAAALDLQVERSINGRFESTELGALRQGDRVRFRVRVPESGTLVMTAGANLARSTLAEVGRTYYLPDANGLPPGDAPIQVAIALHPAVQGERANLFRARQAASDKPAAAALGSVGGVPPGAPAAEPLRDTRREDAGKAKEQEAPKQQAAGRLAQTANEAVPPTAPRTVTLRLEFKPR